MALFDLTGKIAVVTGGNSGIGQGIAHGLVECGATVVVVGRDESKTEGVVAELNAEREGSAVGIRCDVSQAEDVRALVDGVVERLGTINILVNNAGIGIRKRP